MRLIFDRQPVKSLISAAEDLPVMFQPIVFQPIAHRWNVYRDRWAKTWPLSDPRHGLSGEVIVRLGQLDITLEHCKAAIAATDDPEERKRKIVFTLQAQPKFARGEMSEEEYIAGITRITSIDRKDRKDLLRTRRAFEEVVLFTEMFYMIAFRLVEILSSPRPRRFDGITKIRGRCISDARNLLIIHPEHRGGSADYSQTMVITDDGPTLKTTGAVVRGNTRRTEALPDSLDRGLFVNAAELSDELRAAIQAGIDHKP